MNAVHLHLTLIHLPIVLVPTSVCIALIGIWRSSLVISRVGLWLLIFAATIAIPTFLSGGEAEEIVEHLAGASKNVIEEHEEAAELALWMTLLAGLLGICSLWAISRGARLERLLLRATLSAGCISALLLGQAAFRGGKIRHPEAFVATSTAAHASHEHDD
jgi:uncharacterized membrane protein